jgi:hypothetical protein
MIILMDTTQKMSEMQLHYCSLLLDLLLSFDSSQMVLTACIGFQSVREMGLQELRKKHKPEILTAIEEQSVWASFCHYHVGSPSGCYSSSNRPSSLRASCLLRRGECQVPRCHDR